MGPEPLAPWGPTLGDLPPNHEGADGTPEPTHQGVADQDQGPPPGPEQFQHRVVGTCLGPKPERQIHRDEQPAHQAVQQSIPEPGSPHPLAQLWLPAPKIKPGLLAPIARPEHFLGKHGWQSCSGRLLPGLTERPIHQGLQFAQVVGEVMVLQPADRRIRYSGGLFPPQTRALQPDHVANPVPQVLTAHPQGWNSDQ